MKRNMKFGKVFSAFLLFFGAFFVLFPNFFALAETVSSMELVPPLDISKFIPYKIKADVSGSPISVTVNVSGINGDGGIYWNYYASGTPVFEAVTKTMYASSTWYESQNIYPDNIYPEIYFAPSSITWGNTPLDISTRRGSYHLLHLNNPFTMVASSSFFIEVNAVPVSLVNSADLDVYLVAKDKPLSFFNSDWRSSSDVELVGTINRSTSFHHTHATSSSHYLVALNTDTNTKIGIKNIDVSGDFWVILYSNSPNTNRGWNLKYQPSHLCNNSNGWYVGNQTGWTTNAQSGCPDAHIHIARRDAMYSDGITASITADYGLGETATSTGTFYFNELPNLAPNQTSFISPVIGGIYDGGGADEVSVVWDPASDPNDGDILNYTIYLLDSSGNVTSTLISATSSVSFTWDISSVPNGIYSLKGSVCDDDASSLCTEFYLGGNFTIEKTIPVYALNSISIVSDNPTATLARAGNTVTLSFTSTGALSSTSVEFYSGGEAVADTPVITNTAGNDWTATYTVDSSDEAGTVSFVIRSSNLDFEYFETTDSTSITVYKYSLVYTAGANGYISGEAVQSVAHGESGTEVIAVPSANYAFSSWSDGVSSANRTDTNVTGNISVSANFQLVPIGGGAVRLPPVIIETTPPPVAVSVSVGSTSTSATSENEQEKPIGEMTIPELLKKIEEIKSKIEDLKKQPQDAKPGAISAIPERCTFNRYMRYGDSGEEVECLQFFLKSQGSEIYPEGIVSGWFGPLTKQAVIRFQEKYADDILTPWNETRGTGYVYKTTTIKINEILGR